MSLPSLDAAALAAALPVAEAVDALEAALLAGLDPASDPARSTVEAPAGSLLVMPSVAGGTVAVKLVTVAPGNPERGLPRISGVAVLFDPDTLTPVALVDGAVLTAIRTPAVSALAVRHVARPDAARLVVFGSGPQAHAHVAALRAVRPLREVVVVGRDAARAEALAAACTGSGLAARVGDPGAVAHADLVVCATSARVPVLDGARVPDGACVVAVGSHEPSAREVDEALVRRSRLVVEDRATALREAGDLVLAGAVPEALESIADVVRAGLRHEPGRPTLVKTVGMAWEDAVVAGAALAKLRSDGSVRGR